MRKFFIFSLGFVAATTLFAGVALWAQDNAPTHLLRPLVVDLQQQIPIIAEIYPPDASTPITVPMTVDVNLQVAIRSELSATLTVITPTTPARFTVTMPTLGVEQTDALGKPYTVYVNEEDQADIALSEWTTFATEGDYISISGALARPERSIDFQQAEVVVRFFDREDKLIDVIDTVTGYDLQPTESDRFEMRSSVDVDDAQRYEVEITLQR